MSCGVDHRRGSDPALLWLWCRPVATSLIRPLAWEPPYAARAAQGKTKRQRPKKKKKKERKKRKNSQEGPALFWILLGPKHKKSDPQVSKCGVLCWTLPWPSFSLSSQLPVPCCPQFHLSGLPAVSADGQFWGFPIHFLYFLHHFILQSMAYFLASTVFVHEALLVLPS